MIAQICADALGVAVADLDLVGPDTALTPDCGKTSASRQTYITGKAAEMAGRALRARILAMTNMGEDAVIRPEPGALRVSDGRGERRIDLVALEPDGNGYVLAAEESYDPPTGALDERAGRALCGLRLWRADGRGRGGYGARHGEGAADHGGA
ncbi:molybdopterin cofactor-binding domain-containing protein [Jhaorihella thermophila]